MNFEKAVTENNKEKRDQLITKEIESHYWHESVADLMAYGGWPEEAYVDSVTITAEDDEQIVAEVSVSFVESAPTGCGDLNRNYHGRATIRVTIDREDGQFETEVEESDVDDVPEIRSGDYN